MKTEPSDIIKLLGELGREDWTCHELRVYAERGESILNVCHEVIRILAAEKAHALKQLAEMVALLPPPPIVMQEP